MIIGFFSLWIILCGNMTGEILVIGAVATAVVFWFTCRYCRWSLRREKLFLRLLLPGLGYIVLLLWEIIKANLAMLKLLLRPRVRQRLEPHIISIQVPLRTNIARMTLCNSITLTPGTITVENRNTEFLLHCIHPHFAENVDCSAMVEALEKMEAIVFSHEEAGNYD
ncbi:MAG: Na+/H+ antiporter subunit E [Oscillospiraceae bacterium]|nr:Na+/H+ antiporter subunit E [Oscillospiraceae bacterium]